MQAIVTKYLGPTHARGSRIKAMAKSGSVTVPFNYAADEYETAARALCEKMGWAFNHCRGNLPDGSIVWVACGLEGRQ